MQQDKCKSPKGSDHDQQFGLQLELNSKVILQHYKQTGEFVQPSTLPSSSPSLLSLLHPPPSRHQSPTKKYQDSVKSKILELEEEESGLYSKISDVQNTRESQPLTVEKFARQVEFCQKYSHDEESGDLCLIRGNIQKEFLEREEKIRKESKQLLDKLKTHERFIVELIFSLNLVQRLEDDLESMLTVAEENYEKLKRKEMKKRLQQEQKQKQRQMENEREKQRQKHIEIEKEREKKRQEERRVERERANRTDRENSFFKENNFRMARQKEVQFKISPTKLFKPHNKSIDSQQSMKTMQQNQNHESSYQKSNFTNSQQDFTRKSVQQNAPTYHSFLPPSGPKRSPTKPRTSFAFERKGSYITTSPKKTNHQKAENHIDTSFQNDLQKKLQVLFSGRTFKRICYATHTFEEVDMYCSPDYRRLIMRTSNYDSVSMYMDEFIEVKMGKSHQHFEKVRFEELYFSIIFTNKKIDLQAQCLRERNQFVDALYELRRMTHY